jgi:two-component system, cell cycle sensor histidine kinase and response regulator CckA
MEQQEGPQWSASALKQFFHYADSLMFWKDLDGRYMMVNHLFLRYFGLEEQQIIGYYDKDILNEPMLSMVRGHEQQVLTRRGVYTIEEQITLADRAYTFLTKRFPLFNNHGKITGIGGIATDITEQQVRQNRLSRLESQQAEIELAMYAGEQQVRLMLEGSPVTLFTHDRDLRYTWMYNTAPGFANDFFIGKTDWDFIPPAVAEQLTRAKRRALDEGITVTDEFEIFVDGTPTIYELRAMPIRNEANEVVGLRCMGIDRTEQRRLERRLAQTQKLAALGRLASGLAHDFNNSLQIVHASLTLIRDMLPVNHEAQADLDVARKALHNATGLIEQLRKLERSQPERRTRLDLNEIIANALPLMRRVLHKQIELVPALSPSPCVVLANQTQLEQVLLNLCMNANDAIHGSGTLNITTICIPAGETPVVRMVVSDTGMGMDAQTLERIFEPDFTTKQQGTGLGLFMCYTIVHEHGGTITASSVPGVGTQFVIELSLLVDETTT